MIVNKTKCIVFAVILFLCGYLVGALVQLPFVDKGLLYGDIGKANLYNNSINGDAKACVEKLRNDTIYRNHVQASYVLLNSRIRMIDSLVAVTINATEDIAALSELNTGMKTFSVKTKNAMQLYGVLFTETEKVLAGEESAGYEQLVNNAGHAFSVIDNEAVSCAGIVSSLSDCGFESENPSLLMAAAGWMKYGAEDAVLSGDKDAIAKWKDVYASAQKSPSLGKFVEDFPTLKTIVGSIIVTSGTPSDVKNTLAGFYSADTKSLNRQSSIVGNGNLAKILGKVKHTETYGSVLKSTRTVEEARLGNILNGIGRSQGLKQQSERALGI